jgi:cysteine-rich repeat protein
MDVPECGDCGDEVKQEWEACEGNNFGQTTCSTLGYSSGDLACTDRCAIDTSNCCGDGTAGSTEQCDDENTIPLDGCTECKISDFIVNTHTEGGQMAASLASHPSGEFTAVWISDGQDGSGMGVFGQRFDSTGNNIGSEFLINTNTNDNQSSPRTPKKALGDFVVVWTSQEQDGSDSGVFGQRFDSAGNRVGTEFLVNTSTDYNQNEPSVAMLGANEFVVTWAGSDPTNSDIEIFLQRFDANGNPDGGEHRVTVDTQTYQHQPVVASDSAGSFVVVWNTDMHDGSLSEILGQTFDAGGTPIGTGFHINTPSDGDQSEPDIAMDSTGKFVVVWMSYDQDGSEYGVFGRLYDSNGNPITGEFQVNTYTESDQFFPDVSMDEVGNFIVVWASRGQDAGHDGIFAQKYNSSGQPQGEEFQINFPYLQHTVGPSVAMLGQGRFVATWDATDQTTCDIIGQRIDEQGEPRGREAW